MIEKKLLFWLFVDTNEANRMFLPDVHKILRRIGSSDFKDIIFQHKEGEFSNFQYVSVTNIIISILFRISLHEHISH